MTVIFDGGGFDGELFNRLVEQGLDFITDQRGEVHLDDQLFARREVRWDGQRVRFHIAEDAVTVGESGPWRRVVIRTPGHQRPILTSLAAADIAAARVGALMLTRWRQENFFKYARAHLGLDVLTTFAAETVVDHEVPNPAVKAATAELKRLRTVAQKLRAASGRALVLDMDQPPSAADRLTAKTRRPQQVPPTTRAALIAQLQTPEETKSQLRSLPGRVPLSSSGLQPPDFPLHRRALVGLCEDLNRGRLVFAGTHIGVRHEVVDGGPTARRHANHAGES